MVITPIEEMMTKVKRISENPLKAQKISKTQIFRVHLKTTLRFASWLEN